MGFSTKYAIGASTEPTDPQKREFIQKLLSIGIVTDGVKEGEFPKINPELMFKALGGLFMGLVFMGDKKEPVSEKDVEKLLNQLIADPNYSSK